MASGAVERVEGWRAFELGLMFSCLTLGQSLLSLAVLIDGTADVSLSGPEVLVSTTAAPGLGPPLGSGGFPGELVQPTSSPTSWLDTGHSSPARAAGAGPLMDRPCT